MCRNYVNSALSDMTRAEIRKNIEDKKGQADYNRGRCEFEDIFDDVEPGKQLRNAKSRIELPEFHHGQGVQG